jgi:transposase
MLVYRWVQLHREVDARALNQSQSPTEATAKKMAPRHLSWFFLRDPSHLQKPEQEALAFLRQQKDIDLVYALAQQFVSMVKERKADQLSPWLGACQMSRITELVNFAQGLENEGSALHAAFESFFSNVRQRTDQIDAFTTETSCLTIVRAVMQDIHLPRIPVN